MYTQTAKAACPRVNALRAELGNAERREKLEGDLAALQSTGPVTPAVREADPGSAALATYLASLGFDVPANGLTDWLVLIPVLALEVGAALSGVLVQSACGRRNLPLSKDAPLTQAAVPAGKPVDGHAPTLAQEAKQPRTQTVDANSPAAAPRRKRARTATERLSMRRRPGLVTTLTKVDAQVQLLDMLRRRGGRIEDASVRGLARLIGAKKSTAHNAIATLIGAGIVARLGSGLVLQS
jgi:hypothetical protein